MASLKGLPPRKLPRTHGERDALGGAVGVLATGTAMSNAALAPSRGRSQAVHF
jgi:hypothetical protein